MSMLGLLNQLFQTPKLDLEGITFQQQAPTGSGEVNVLGYKVRNYRDAGKLGGYTGAALGAYAGATTYGLTSGLGLLGVIVGGFILGGLAGLGLYGLYRGYKALERQYKRATQPQPTG